MKTIVIVGGGFAGLQLIEHLGAEFSIVLIDQNNFHQFQPLLYQVAIGELDPSGIVFPFRNFLMEQKNLRFVKGKLKEVWTAEQKILLEDGTSFSYDFLVFAMGTVTHFFNNSSFEQNCLPLKSLDDSLHLRNKILQHLEFVAKQEKKDQAKYLQLSIIGGGPTGIEIAAILYEMKKNILAREYPEIDFSFMELHIVEAGDRLLSGMSPKSSSYALKKLQKIGIKVLLQKPVKNYEKGQLLFNDGSTLQTAFCFWTAGVQAQKIPLETVVLGRGNRVLVNAFLQIKDHQNLYCIGDQALVENQNHPQVAQVAIQQGKYLARFLQGKIKQPFVYKDKGSMAILGSKDAVADIAGFHFNGIFAWLLWSVVHLLGILGVKNKLFVFFNWIFFYFSKKNNLRLITKK